MEQSTLPRVYLDNAATSWPKDEKVLAAVEDYLRNCGATAGRGAYASAQTADRWLVQARTCVARLVGAASPHDIAICNSGTHALNAALSGLLSEGDHVITTSMEHNSVLRPLRNIAARKNIKVEVMPCDRSGRVDRSAVNQAIRDETRMLAVGHASNVTGAVQDLEVWREIAESRDALFMLDASQTLGYIPIDLRDAGIDILAAAAHKGLGAIGGTGILAVSQKHQTSFQPILLGGTGRASESIDQTPEWPQSVEVGNLNMPGVVSIAEAAQQRGENPLIQGWEECFIQLVKGLRQIEGVELVGWSADELNSVAHEVAQGRRIPVVSMHVAGWDVHDLASVLDTSFGIETRAGWHCAALVHADVGSVDTGGTLRLSTGAMTSREQIEYTLQALREVLGS